MTLEAWIMLAVTWTVVIGFTVRFYVMALRLEDLDDGDEDP